MSGGDKAAYLVVESNASILDTEASRAAWNSGARAAAACSTSGFSVVECRAWSGLRTVGGAKA